MKYSHHILFWLIVISISCSNERTKPVSKKKGSAKNATAQVILVQPFADLPPDQLKYVESKLKTIVKDIQILPTTKFPTTSYYKPRNRYRADSVISWLSKKTPVEHITLGLTSKDISTTKGDKKDFGVMGLGYRPGNACIASSYRLKPQSVKNESLFKVAIHELGHTQGLDHCPQKTCFMRDAEGGNPTEEEKEFCPSCKEYLIKKGWRL